MNWFYIIKVNFRFSKNCHTRVAVCCYSYPRSVKYEHFAPGNNIIEHSTCLPLPPISGWLNVLSQGQTLTGKTAIWKAFESHQRIRLVNKQNEV